MLIEQTVFTPPSPLSMTASAASSMIVITTITTTLSLLLSFLSSLLTATVSVLTVSKHWLAQGVRKQIFRVAEQGSRSE